MLQVHRTACGGLPGWLALQQEWGSAAAAA